MAEPPKPVQDFGGRRGLNADPVAASLQRTSPTDSGGTMHRTISLIAVVALACACGPDQSTKTDGGSGVDAGGFDADAGAGTDGGGLDGGGFDGGPTDVAVDGGTDASRYQPSTFAEFRDANWRLVCDYLFNCPNKQDRLSLVNVGERFASEQDCEASTFRDGRPAYFDQLQDAITAGRVTFDASKAPACLQAIRDDVCDGVGQLNLPPTECDGLLVGMQGADDACVLDAECSGDLVCNTDDGPSTCYQTCGQPVGPACGDSHCGTGEYCDDQQTCQPRVADGQPCTKDAMCKDLSACLIPNGMDSGTCTAWGSLAQGDDCGSSPVLSDFFCDDTLGCDTQTWTCQPIEFLDEGDACEKYDDLHLCHAGLTCASTDSGMACEPPHAMGEACSYSQACVDALRCADVNAGTGTCKPRLDVGEGCATFQDCKSTTCVGGMCEANDVCQIP